MLCWRAAQLPQGCRICQASTVRYLKEHVLRPRALLLWESPRTFHLQFTLLAPVQERGQLGGRPAKRQHSQLWRTTLLRDPSSGPGDIPTPNHLQSLWWLQKKNANALFLSIILTPLEVCSFHRQEYRTNYTSSRSP